MTKLEAIDERSLRRLYLNEPIDASVKAELQTHIDAYNIQSGLSIRFIEDGSAPFSSFRKTYGLFSGVRSILEMVGPTKGPLVNSCLESLTDNQHHKNRKLFGRFKKKITFARAKN